MKRPRQETLCHPRVPGRVFKFRLQLTSCLHSEHVLGETLYLSANVLDFSQTIEEPCFFPLKLDRLLSSCTTSRTVDLGQGTVTHSFLVMHDCPIPLLGETYYKNYRPHVLCGGPYPPYLEFYLSPSHILVPSVRAIPPPIKFGTQK